MLTVGFHTPKLPKALGLDLAELTGGGSFPSQFYGQTHDGRDVYARYRGGTLRVHVGKQLGDDALRCGDCILEEEIGPPFDGAMSLSQFCDNFGVTVNGSVPAETDPEAHRYKDLTGQTTFWDAHVSRVTVETSRKFVGRAWSCFPNALLVKAVTDSQFSLERLQLTTPSTIDTLCVWMVDGPSLTSEIKTHPTEYILPKSGQLQISISYSAWKYPVPKYTGQVKIAEQALNKVLYVAGERDTPDKHALCTDSLSFHAAFPTEDRGSRASLERLSELLRQELPQTIVDRIDLATGQIVGQLTRPLDPVIVRWCATEPHRWISVLKDTKDGPWIGIRPAKREMARYP